MHVPASHQGPAEPGQSKEMQTDKAMCVHSASLQNGGTTVSSKAGTWALCNLQLDGRKSGSHGIPTENTSLCKHEGTVCTL